MLPSFIQREAKQCPCPCSRSLRYDRGEVGRPAWKYKDCHFVARLGALIGWAKIFSMTKKIQKLTKVQKVQKEKKIQKIQKLRKVQKVHKLHRVQKVHKVHKVKKCTESREITYRYFENTLEDTF